MSHFQGREKKTRHHDRQLASLVCEKKNEKIKKHINSFLTSPVLLSLHYRGILCMCLTSP